LDARATEEEPAASAIATATLELVEARDVTHVGSRRTDVDERLDLRLDESELVGHAEH
jgi:hypothetical protein